MLAIPLIQHAHSTLPSVSYLIDHLIPLPGRVLLVGPPKSGKSFLALQLGLAVAHATPFLGRKAQSGRVLYLQFDNPDPIWLERLRMLLEEGVSLEGDILISVREPEEPNPDILTATGYHTLHRVIQTVNPALIIIDVLSKIHRVNENSAQELTPVITRLNALAEGRSLVVIHHTRKYHEAEGRPTPSTATRGTTVLPAEVEVIMYLDKNVLDIESRVDESISYRLAQDPNTGFWTWPEGQHAVWAGLYLDLCARHPDLSHGQIYAQYQNQIRTSRSTYFRRLSVLPCCHTLVDTLARPS